MMWIYFDVSGSLGPKRINNTYMVWVQLTEHLWQPRCSLGFQSFLKLWYHGINNDDNDDDDDAYSYDKFNEAQSSQRGL